jgi:hypothetical protein
MRHEFTPLEVLVKIRDVYHKRGNLVQEMRYAKEIEILEVAEN